MSKKTKIINTPYGDIDVYNLDMGDMTDLCFDKCKTKSTKKVACLNDKDEVVWIDPWENNPIAESIRKKLKLDELAESINQKRCSK